MSDDPNILVQLPGHCNLWMRQSSLDAGEGALMPEPDHDLTLGESYAHLFDDGRILRYREVIGHKDDLIIIP